MRVFEHKQALGLDIGQAVAKAVLVSRRGNRVTITAAHKLDCRAEGILDEQELATEVGPWLDKQGWSRKETVAGIPQYLATTQVTDFPPGSEGNLDGMVRFETQHLAGLSEEAFIYDHQLMTSTLNDKRPVLIGICRQSVVEERAHNLQTAGVRLADVTINATALAAAYLHLYPQETASEAPQLLIDVGAENSTVVVLAGRQILFTSALMFGVEQYIQQVAQELGSSIEKVREDMADPDHIIRPADANSPYVKAASMLRTELQGALENWRAQEASEVAKVQFASVSLCGGGAHVNGLDAYIGAIFKCPSQVIGVPLPGNETRDPVLVTAYGLALQGVSASPLHISLAPKAVRSQAMRRLRFPYLVAAAGILAAIVTFVEVKVYSNVVNRRQTLQRELKSVNLATSIVPELEDTLRKIAFRQKTLIPLVEKGNHARRFLQSLAELSDARETMAAANRNAEGWIVYLADKQSFQTGRQSRGDAAPLSETGNPLLAPSSTTEPSDGASSNGGSHHETRRIPVTAVKPLDGMIAALYTTSDPNEPYRFVKNFINRLNTEDKQTERGAGPSSQEGTATNFFTNVDLMPEAETAGREDIFIPWVSFFKEARTGSYRRFTLRLPFNTQDVHLPREREVVKCPPGPQATAHCQSPYFSSPCRPPGRISMCCARSITK
ncbi:MAG: pilus assembly protein PilM [Candidatus Pacebacteria bacterium]|nr:pilus assembly protein PilM [Candidatus Paceibacterota bacterium]